MKIVILSDDFPPTSLGGAEVIASNLAFSLSDRGHDVTVITTTKIVGEEGRSIEGNVTIHKIHSDYPDRFRAYVSLYNPKVVSKVEAILSEIRPDITHAHNVHRNLSYASLKTAKKHSRAVFLTLHDVMTVHYGKLGGEVDASGKAVMASTNPLRQIKQYKWRYNPFRNIVIRHYLRSVDKILAVSHSLKQVLESRGISSIEVMHNGIGVDKWLVDDDKLSDFKSKYNLQNKKVMFFGGRLSAIKGGLIVLEVLKKVLNKTDNVVLLVVGDKNGWAQTMQKKAKEMGIDEKIIFTGWIPHDEIKYAYSASDLVFVLSLCFDSFPTSNLEAMACQKPLISTLFGGSSEVIVEDKTGYVVNPRDIDSVTVKTLELLMNADKAKSFGLAGYDKVKNSFSLEDWVDKTLLCYADYLDKNHDRR